MIRRLARRVHALAVVVNRATALADSRDECVRLAARVAHLERVVDGQSRSVRESHVMAWRYWAAMVDYRDRLRELEPVVTGEQT